jgi:rhodanese-related sulfurtransferase
MNARVELPSAREVCPTTTRRLLAEGALLVDVRERSEIERLAIDVPEIVVMPLSEFEQRFAELPRDRQLVMVCQTGARSLKATYFLMYQGYEQVANMEGGIFKWASKGFAISGAPGTTASSASRCCGGPAAAGACCGGDQAAAASDACCSAPKAAVGGCC